MNSERIVKDWLKTKFKYDAFIEHTQVSEMCIAYKDKITNKVKNEIALRFQDNEDFIKNEGLSSREKNMIRNEERFLNELLEILNNNNL